MEADVKVEVRSQKGVGRAVTTKKNQDPGFKND